MALVQQYGVPCSKVEICISCSDLIDKDVTSKSDPCAVLMMQDSGKWFEVGRTENVKNCLNPQFAKSFEVDYMFEEVQNLRFMVYDLDNKTPDLSDDDFLGSMDCTMGQLVSSSPYTQPLVLKGGKRAGKGTITVRAEEIAKLQDVLNMSFRAQGLDNKDFLGKSDPYLEFSRQTPDGGWQVVLRTEVVKNDLNPKWRTIVVKAQKLCAGNYESPIKVVCFDYDSDGSHDLIGSFMTSGTELMKAVDQQISWPVINPKKKAKKKSYTNSGTVFLTSCMVTKEYSFLDFIFGGMQINFTVGIDFTGSNGDPRSPQSLHYINPYQPNEYQKAIRAVGNVVQDYDSDRMFPALGFGALTPPEMSVSHEFAINFNPNNPFCSGIDGILAAYQACIPQVRLYGPTNFSPIIYHVSQFAAAAQKEEGAKNYFVLLILTDGVISDINETKTAIVKASGLPMSIIIVGVGFADFSAMDCLDSDDGLLKDHTGHRAVRDIVQFVPFRKFENAPPAALAKSVLAEVPSQVTQYYRMMKITPGLSAPAK
ncbi:hypothetical protein CAPTEDRAFT_150478 [Capitella teleta]|uniref:Copine-3 n=1 Tax=Capitella teleta TaxID=283909 RepID=R7TBK9_CAPTE|nr:hypothetical protein CAPTEDRAFT_150478 [Capitella teleta]|eukprot:ELT91123.1 hypothetical protein CAPTEDRAFT_150478 [Capitella teleta]